MQNYRNSVSVNNMAFLSLVLVVISVYLSSFVCFDFPGSSVKPVIVIHGGAGTVDVSGIPARLNGVRLAEKIGYDALARGLSALDAVEAAVNSLELDENFNAGYGSVLTWDGTVEEEASIMDGSTLEAGCVSLVTDIMHPISLARKVMTDTRHNYLAGEGVMKFAVEKGFEILPPGALVTEGKLKALEDFKNSFNSTKASSDKYEPGTVGAVAIDKYGNIAAATSTGGMTGKLPGRIGDTPILGAGNYAENELGGMSATGDGESIMKFNVGQKVLQLSHWKELSLQSASEQVLTEMTAKLNATAGFIGVDPKGNVAVFYTSKHMSWAYRKDGCVFYGIEKGDFFKDCENF